jgi:hypothetical protein
MSHFKCLTSFLLSCIQIRFTESCWVPRQFRIISKWENECVEIFEQENNVRSVERDPRANRTVLGKPPTKLMVSLRLLLSSEVFLCTLESVL